MLYQSELPLLVWRLYHEAWYCSGGQLVRRHVPGMCGALHRVARTQARVQYPGLWKRRRSIPACHGRHLSALWCAPWSPTSTWCNGNTSDCSSEDPGSIPGVEINPLLFCSRPPPPVAITFPAFPARRSRFLDCSSVPVVRGRGHVCKWRCAGSRGVVEPRLR